MGSGLGIIPGVYLVYFDGITPSSSACCTVVAAAWTCSGAGGGIDGVSTSQNVIVHRGEFSPIVPIEARPPHFDFNSLFDFSFGRVWFC